MKFSEWITIDKYYKQIRNETSVLGCIHFHTDVPKYHQPWYWEARTPLESRDKDMKPPSGYVQDENSAMVIVECILRMNNLI